MIPMDQLRKSGKYLVSKVQSGLEQMLIFITQEHRPVINIIKSSGVISYTMK